MISAHDGLVISGVIAAAAASISSAFINTINGINAKKERAVQTVKIEEVKVEQGKTAGKIEEVHGLVNSASVELKRLVAFAFRRVANLTNDPGDIKAAEDAEKIYNDAVLAQKASRTSAIAEGHAAGVADEKASH